MKRGVFLLFFTFLVSSCGHVISTPMRDQATDVPFTAIKGNIDRYKGEIFLLGGVIVETKLTDVGSMVEAVNSPIDNYGKITDPDITLGRFIAVTKDYLDPLIYKKGREITIAGELVGSRKKELGEIQYEYPLFEIKELYIWKERKEYYYAPYYPPYRHRYPYWWYDPWYEPYYPPPYP